MSELPQLSAIPVGAFSLNISSLCLKANSLTSLSGIEALAGTLECLDISENLLESLDGQF